MDELWQSIPCHEWNEALAEVIVVKPEHSSVGSKAKLMWADRPGQIVIEEEARRAASLHPGIVQASDRRERRVRAAALQHDREGGQRLLRVGRSEQTLVPGE